MNKTLNEIEESIKNKEYEIERSNVNYLSETHIFDENQTVKWNKDKVQMKNAEVSEIRKKEKHQQEILKAKMLDEIVCALASEFDINYEQARFITNYTWKNSGTSLYLLDEAKNLADNYKSLLDLEK